MIWVAGSWLKTNVFRALSCTSWHIVCFTILHLLWPSLLCLPTFFLVKKTLLPHSLSSWQRKPCLPSLLLGKENPASPVSFLAKKTLPPQENPSSPLSFLAKKTLPPHSPSSWQRKPCLPTLFLLGKENKYKRFNIPATCRQSLRGGSTSTILCSATLKST